MNNIQLQPVRAYSTLCSVCGERIEPERPAWHEPARNWHAHERCGEKLDAWIGSIVEGMKR